MNLKSLTPIGLPESLFDGDQKPNGVLLRRRLHDFVREEVRDFLQHFRGLFSVLAQNVPLLLLVRQQVVHLQALGSSVEVPLHVQMGKPQM